jgi:DNA-binding winged helix-turn-helix (wHTH) protein/TolB-like protein
MPTDRIRFGEFEADPSTGELRRRGRRVPIQDLPFRLLVTLLERPGQLWSREELATRLWGSDTFVDAISGLNTAVAKLRHALDDDAAVPVLVETVPKRGYRFIGTVEPGASVPAEAAQPAVPVMRRRVIWIVAATAALAALGAATYFVLPRQRATKIAVVLFDNETDRPEIARLSQALTDATVFALTAQSRLAVVGNAAILRTDRPFRDLAAIRDALGSDFIVIGQVQTLDDVLVVRAHLIRGRDLAHVWVGLIRAPDGGEAAFQSKVADRIAAAVTAHL